MNVYRISKRTGKTYTVEYWDPNHGMPETRQFTDLEDAAQKVAAAVATACA